MGTPIRSRAWLGLFVIAPLAWGGLAYGQAGQSRNFFGEVGDSDLSADQSKLTQQIKAQPTTKRMRVVRLDLGLLDQETEGAEAVVLNLFPQVSLSMRDTSLERRTAQDYTWKAVGADKDTQATVVVKRNTVFGTVRSGKDYYVVRPVGQGLYALIEVDQSKFPSDHPPNADMPVKEPESSPLGDAPLGPRLLQDEGNVLATLVAYTTAVRTALGSVDAAEGLAQVAVDETNQSYANSGIPLRLHLVHAYETSYVESGNMLTDRNRFRIAGDGFMDEVHDRRNESNADVAVLLTNSGGACGIAAAILADAATAFAVVHPSCATGNYSFGHEIGHLLGARHNPETDPTTTPFAYGHGYYNQAAHWRTVMSYDCPGGCTRIPYWSDPMVTFGGAVTGTAAKHNNARVLGETSPTIANFRRTTAPADRMAYAWAHNPTAASYTPSPAYSFNSSGKTITIARSAVGRYAVTFDGLGGAGGVGGNVQVTAYGPTSENCKVASWASGGASFRVNVRCFNASGSPVDTRYTTLVTWPK